MGGGRAGASGVEVLLAKIYPEAPLAPPGSWAATLGTIPEPRHLYFYADRQLLADQLRTLTEQVLALDDDRSCGCSRLLPGRRR